MKLNRQRLDGWNILILWIQDIVMHVQSTVWSTVIPAEWALWATAACNVKTIANQILPLAQKKVRILGTVNNQNRHPKTAYKTCFQSILLIYTVGFLFVLVFRIQASLLNESTLSVVKIIPVIIFLLKFRSTYSAQDSMKQSWRTTTLCTIKSQTALCSYNG